MGWGVRTPATTSSPWALIRYSPKIPFSPVAGFLVKATPVPEVSPHVAEYHGLYVDRRSPVAGDVVHPAVYDGPVVIPGTEHGPFTAPISCSFASWGKSSPFMASLYTALKTVLTSSFRSSHRHLGVIGDAFLLLHLVDDLLEIGFWYLHYHVGIHLDKRR